MATEATKLGLQFVSSGSLSLFDMDIERRPYHKNCSCALHKSKAGSVSTACLHCQTILFPKKKIGNDRTLSVSITASEFSSPSSSRSRSTLTRNRNYMNMTLLSRRTEVHMKPEWKGRRWEYWFSSNSINSCTFW